MAKDYYHILGVDKAATQDEIKKAFRKLAHTHHPDKQGGDEARFKEINEAYGVLGDPEKRRQYDQFGSGFQQGGFGGASQGFGGFDFSQFGGANFEDLFTDIFTGGGRHHQARGRDVQVDIEIQFDEMVHGTKRELPLRTFVACSTCQGKGGKPGSAEKTCTVCHGQGQLRQEARTILGVFSQVMPCTQCRGRGKTFVEACPDCRGEGRRKEERRIEVAIPAGIENGQAVALTGQGEAGESGVPAGDLLVVVHVRPHEHFERRGNDIFSVLKLTYTQFVLGAKVDVPTLEGSVMMKIPAGTQPGEIFRIKGGGIPYLRRSGKGDQLVKTQIVIPKQLSRLERQAIEALDQAH